MPEKFTECPAIGTRVYLEGCPGMWLPHVRDQAGIVSRHLDHGNVIVNFDNGHKGHGEWRYLRPEAPEAAVPTPEAVIIGGKRYVLAEPPEAPEVKREPKQGEIWRGKDGTRLFMAIDSAPGGRREGWVELRNGSQMALSYDALIQHGGTYAYPSLAAAIEAGETFK